MALVHCQFFSEALQVCVSVDVILPEETTAQIGMRGRARGAEAPVLYLLHGLSDDHSIWQRRTSIERYAAPLGLAVVMPAVNRSFYADMEAGYKYWSYVSEELPARMRSFFRVSGRREDTFVAGLSMGGYGAFKLAMNQPERFAAAASLSGAVDLVTLALTPGEISDDFRLAFGSRDKIRGSRNDLFACAKRLAALPARRRPKLYQCCGTGDGLYGQNVRFRDHLMKLGLDLTYEDGSGEHEWGYWDRQIQRVLAWLPLKKGVTR